jgi:hypothetical protein
MQGVTRQLILAVLFVAPAFFLTLLLGIATQKDRVLRRLPFQELRRRPPGEFLRVKLDGLNEAITEWTLFLIGLPAIVGTIVGLIPGIGNVVLLTFFGFTFFWTAGCTWKVSRLLRERANYRLGFEGERFVAEELNRLLAKGFEVYHDLPFENFNIDHVVVGAPGVFAIETKARRKPVNESGDKEYRVAFDGSCLLWPNGSRESRSIEQAVSNAHTLSEWLSGAIGEQVPVTAILSLPGWMVDRKAPPKPVHVLNPKEIGALCNSIRGSLEENLLKRIRYLLDQKCRMEIE